MQTESALAHDVTQTKVGIEAVGRPAQRWSIVQNISLLDQLNAGVRYVDFRMVWTAPANASSSAPHDFYCNHRVQTAETAMWCAIPLHPLFLPKLVGVQTILLGMSSAQFSSSDF